VSRNAHPIASVLLLVVSGCVPPEVFRRVGVPREGRVMNGRVAVVYSRHYRIQLGGLEKLHPFDVNKLGRIYLKLNTEGLIRPEDVFVPEPADERAILRVHTPGFLASLRKSRNVAAYLEAPAVALVPHPMVDAGVLSPFRHVTGGTILAGRLALEHGIAINLGGGYHHARPDAGEGFCVYNDMAIAIRALQAEGRCRRAAIVDLDVHQGNGSAVCFAGDEDVFTFSMHQGEIYPIPKAASDRDVELPAGMGDAAYLRLLGAHLPAVLDAARPQIVFLQAGCDVLAGDPLAGLKMTPGGIVQRDAVVIDECVRRGIPVVMVLGGGYSAAAWEVQYASIRRSILQYGTPAGRPPHPPREPTKTEGFYTR
jgi:histone deacetylase 11